MTGRQVFNVWAPAESPWSRWVSPLPFLDLDCRETAVQVRAPAAPESAPPPRHPHDAVIVDLPGAECIRAALALADRGYRPVLISNAVPAPSGLADPRAALASLVLDNSALLHEICLLTPGLSARPLPPGAPPAFIIDSARLKGTHRARRELFDNRWQLVPQDFPTGRFLLDRGIRSVTLLQTMKVQPQEDLAKVLLRWQSAGLRFFVQDAIDGVGASLIVEPPSPLKSAIRYILAKLGVALNTSGAFGSPTPGSSSSG